MERWWWRRLFRGWFWRWRRRCLLGNCQIAESAKDCQNCTKIQPLPRITLIYTENQRQNLPRICADVRGLKTPPSKDPKDDSHRIKDRMRVPSLLFFMS